jgi:hypothetical protein
LEPSTHQRTLAASTVDDRAFTPARDQGVSLLETMVPRSVKKQP